MVFASLQQKTHFERNLMEKDFFVRNEVIDIGFNFGGKVSTLHENVFVRECTSLCASLGANVFVCELACARVSG